MKKVFAVLAVILIVMAVSCSAMLRSAAEGPDSRPIPDPALVKDGVYRGVGGDSSCEGGSQRDCQEPQNYSH